MESLVQFLLESEKLKSVLRKTKPLGLDRYENSAEHSWQTALVAMLLMDRSGAELDQLKVLKMLLIHDVVEIDAGDVFVYDTAARAAIVEAEMAAADRLFGLLDEPLSSDLKTLWLEFEKGESNEAIFAKAVDRVMPVLQNINSEGQSWVEHDITLEQVLQRNAPIADASAELWSILEAHIRELDLPIRQPAQS